MTGRAQHIDAGHRRHTLIGEDHGESPLSRCQLIDQVECFLATPGTQNLIRLGVPRPQVAHHGAENLRLVVDRQYDRQLRGHRARKWSAKQYFQLSPGSIDWTRGWPSASKWARACLFLESSQQPTSPQYRQERR